MGILNRSLFLKQLQTWKVGSICSINSTNLRRMAARYLSLNTTPSITIGWLCCGIYLSIWDRWNASLESGLNFKSYHLLVNGIPTQSWRLGHIASILLNIAPRFATYSTGWWLTLTTLSCLPWQMALAHHVVSHFTPQVLQPEILWGRAHYPWGICFVIIMPSSRHPRIRFTYTRNAPRIRSPSSAGQQPGKARRLHPRDNQKN